MEQLSSKKVIEKLTEIKRLPHMPEALLELNHLLSLPEEIHVERVSKVIMRDPRLTAGLLRVVNSAKYRVAKPIESLPEAIARLGVNDLRVMALAINYGEAFVKDSSLDRDEFLQYSLLAAHIGMLLARQTKLEVDPYNGFMIGLMHDVGLYLLLQCRELDYQEVVKSCQYRATSIVTIENKLLGFSHANVGAQLLKVWGFPESVYMGVLGHHAPALLSFEHQPAAFLGYLSEVGAFYLRATNGLLQSEVGRFSDAVLMVLARVGIELADFERLLEQAVQMTNESAI